jgi:MarR family 2-MHQ and catechol resistance regulon transcriptional repressor
MVRFESFGESNLLCDSLGEETLVAIFRTYNTILKDFNRLFARFGLTEPQFNILVLLAKKGNEGMVFTEIGRKMLVSRANVTGLIDRLEREGFITRNGQPNDRRTKLAMITEKGLDMLRRIIPSHCDKINQLTAALNGQEKRALVGSLTKVNQTLGKG